MAHVLAFSMGWKRMPWDKRTWTCLQVQEAACLPSYQSTRAIWLLAGCHFCWSSSISKSCWMAHVLFCLWGKKTWRCLLIKALMHQDCLLHGTCVGVIDELTVDRGCLCGKRTYRYLRVKRVGALKYLSWWHMSWYLSEIRGPEDASISKSQSRCLHGQALDLHQDCLLGRTYDVVVNGLTEDSFEARVPPNQFMYRM